MDVSKARSYALAALGRRDMSRAELIDKLTRAGADEALAEDTADWLEGNRILDDARYADSIIRRYAGRGYGEGRIRDEMTKRGIDRQLRDEKLAELDDFGDAAYAFLKKRLSGIDPRGLEARGALDAARRRGFSWDQITAARDRCADDTEDSD
jgi:regulatory protein